MSTYDDDYDYDYYDDHPDAADALGDEDDDDRSDFADPGGTSALRAATPNNPRNLPCPTCHAPNVLTPADKARGYQCDPCANACEQGRDRDLVCGGAENGCPICKEDEESSEERKDRIDNDILDAEAEDARHYSEEDD